MKVVLSRLLRILLLMALPFLGIQGCSSTPEEDEDLAGENFEEELANEDADEEGYDEAGEEGENELADENQSDEDEEFADEDMEEGNELEEEFEEEGNQVALNQQQTADDLEEIIASEEGEQLEEIPADNAELTAENMNQQPMDQVPAPIATGAALPETGSKMPYIVRVGETLSSIAQTVYGDQAKWQEMAELTAISDPNLVRPGDVVYYQLNQQTAAFASAYEGTAKEEVTVQAGDTLSGIAQRVYGSFGDWKVIWRHNAHISNPDKLEVGQTITYLSQKTFAKAFDAAKTMTVAQLLNNTFNVSVKTLGTQG